jgi:Ca-activated chloride channel family protein
MKKLVPMTASLLCPVLLFCSLLTPTGRAQELTRPLPDPFSPNSANLIIPQARVYAIRAQAQPIQISDVSADVRILQQVATTTLEIGLTNPSERQQEGEMLVPVPDGAVVRSFTFAGSANEPTAKLLPKAEARTIYRAIVNKLRDPGLLEFAGYNLVRSSVFPVLPGGKQRVRLVYEQVLAADGNRVDYVLPRSESFEATATPWKITVQVRSKTPLVTVYSPSHQIAVDRPAPEQTLVRVEGGAKLEPGPFRLSYLIEGDGLTGSLMAYPDARVGGGYFLLLAGIPRGASAGLQPAIRREVTLVLDRSGSMEGEKIEQVRAAALQVVDGLRDGEAFNIIDYSDSVARFAEQPVIKSSETLSRAHSYLKGIRANGGTNIHDALVEALRQTPTPEMLPLIIFLTDGLPTVGQTREAAIRDAVKATNTHRRRIFSFGVGFDVNAPLLTSIANDTRAVATFVFPRENVEAKVSQVFRRLSGPVLSDPQLDTLDANGIITTQAVRELMPAQLNDVFEGDQIILLGQYQNTDPLNFRIGGNYLGEPRTFDLKFDLNGATTRNAFVPRLWASRKIARLIEEITKAGADSAAAARRGSSVMVPANGAVVDPKMKELVDEIIRLSTEYGILTEYTSFLATEGTDFTEAETVSLRAVQSLYANAQQTRSGMGGVSQAMNNSVQMRQATSNRSNNYLTQNMQLVETTNVQQITDRTFFRRNNRWVDAGALGREKDPKPDRTIEFGTDEFYQLVDRLVAEGRQGILALSGEMLLLIDGKTVLVKAPGK